MAYSSSATEGDGSSGGGGGIFGSLIIPLATKVLSQAQNESGQNSEEAPGNATNKRKGGKITASSRADGIAQRGKTRGKMI